MTQERSTRLFRSTTCDKLVDAVQAAPQNNSEAFGERLQLQSCHQTVLRSAVGDLHEAVWQR